MIPQVRGSSADRWGSIPAGWGFVADVWGIDPHAWGSIPHICGLNPKWLLEWRLGAGVRFFAVCGGIAPGFAPATGGREAGGPPGESPAGTTGQSPAIHRGVGSRGPKSPGRDESNPPWTGGAGRGPLGRPSGTHFPAPPGPSDESLGYSLSPSGLDGPPFHRKQRRTRRSTGSQKHSCRLRQGGVGRLAEQGHGCGLPPSAAATNGKGPDLAAPFCVRGRCEPGRLRAPAFSLSLLRAMANVSA